MPNAYVVSVSAHIPRIAFLGYGSVNRALDALLASRRADVPYACAGIASRSRGWLAGDRVCTGVEDWLEHAHPDVVFEAIPLNVDSGQPAIDYIRAVLHAGAHAISANKGPIVFARRELSALAAERGKTYGFEAAVMDGAPVFSLLRECLPFAGLRAVRGVFTSTATVVLEAIERGGTLADGIARAQRLGVAEADPSYDVDGWDSAVKLCALSNVVFGAELRPPDVVRTGIASLSESEVRRAAKAGEPYRLVGEVTRPDAGMVRARVGPERCALDSPLGVARGTTLVMHYDAAVFPGGLTVTSRDPDPTTTAYGMFTDFVAAMRMDGKLGFE